MSRTILRIMLCMLTVTACTSDKLESDLSVVEGNGQQDTEFVENAVPDGWTLSSSVDLNSQDSIVLNGFNEFSYGIIKEMALKSNHADGFSVSPVSVAIYLGMLANASGGELRSQILNALGAESLSSLNSLCEKMLHYLPCDENGSSIGINNHFWVSDAYTIPEGFMESMERVFNAGTSKVDFKDSSTVPLINKWVSDKTEGLIVSLLDGDWSQYVNTVMLSANTVYFKGEWKSKFKKSETTEENFYVNSGAREVRMMHQTLRASYAENDKAQMIKLDFSGPINDMELYLPAEGIDMSELVSALSTCNQDELRGSSELCDIELSLPCFVSDNESELDEMLKNMGITSISNVDFSPMGLRLLPVSMLHKTSVKIDEDGAELAAVTGGWVGALGPDETQCRKVSLEFNRPFLYLIRNYRTGAILMAGVVADPR